MVLRFVLFTLFLHSCNAYAGDKTYYLDRRSGEMLKYEDDKAVLNINIQSKYTDNHLFENDDKARSSNIYELSPSLKAQYHNDTQMLQLGLWGKSRKVTDFGEDDTTDTYGLVKYHYKLNENQSVVVSSAFFNHYLERGTGLSKGVGPLLSERDHRQSYFVNAAHQIGTEDSNAMLTSMLGFRNTSFQNRPEATDGLNLSANYLFFDFQYRLGGRSYLSSKFAYEDIKHDIGSHQDRKISSALIGLKWHKTSFTHFDITLGALKINFENGALDNKQDFKWDAKLRWSPIEQFEFSFSSLRAVDENRQVENSYLIRDKYGLTATYRYAYNIEFYWQNSYDELEYYFEDGNQSEQSLSSDITVFYKFRRNMSFSLSYIYKELESVDTLDDFKQNTVSVGFSFVI